MSGERRCPVPNKPRTESTSATGKEKETSAPGVRGDDRVTAAVEAGEKQEAVAARVNRHQAEVAARVAWAQGKQEAVAARVNRHQAQVAAEIRAQQATAAERPGTADRALRIIRSALNPAVFVLSLPYHVGRRIGEEVIHRLVGRSTPSTGPA
jgi:hypothetical protein